MLVQAVMLTEQFVYGIKPSAKRLVLRGDNVNIGDVHTVPFRRFCTRINSYLKGIPVHIIAGNFIHVITALVELIIEAVNCGGYLGTKTNRKLK